MATFPVLPDDIGDEGGAHVDARVRRHVIQDHATPLPMRLIHPIRDRGKMCSDGLVVQRSLEIRRGNDQQSVRTWERIKG